MKTSGVYAKWTAVVGAVLVATLSSLGQDSVTFKSGRTIDCKVQSFEDGRFSMIFEGQTRFAPATNIQSIQFSEEEEDFSALETTSETVEIVQPDYEGTLPKLTTTSEAAEPNKPKPATDGKDTPIDSEYTPDIKLSVHGYNEKPTMTYHAELRDIKKGGMKFATVDIQVINNSKNAIMVSWDTFKLQTQDGTICEATPWVPEVGSMERTIVRPGDKAKGRIGFKVPIGIVMPRSQVRYDIRHEKDSPNMYSDWYPIR